MDTAAGKFKVGGLDAGTYWLHETTAPDGYTINKTLYQFTIDANGNVTWNGGWASGEATGAIDEKLKPTAKYGTLGLFRQIKCRRWRAGS